MDKCYMADLGCVCVCVFFVFYLSTFKFNIKDVAPGRSTFTLKHIRVNLFTMRYCFPSDIYTNFTFSISQFSATESRMIALDNYNRLHLVFRTHSQFFTPLSSVDSLRKQKGITGAGWQNLAAFRREQKWQ